MDIRPATFEDLPAILAIYNHYVEHEVVTFDVVPVTVAERHDWFLSFDDEHPCFVCEGDDVILGYAYYTRMRAKPAYDRTKETTVYVSHDQHGRGVGSALYGRLIDHARAAGVHALLGVLGGGNLASAALHRKFGFELVGHLKEVGFKFGRYVDTYYYEKLL